MEEKRITPLRKKNQKRRKEKWTVRQKEVSLILSP
jgi:hypothetical protein